MNRKLDELLDWSAVEGIVYSDTAYPKEALEPKLVDEGLLVQTFLPKAASVLAVLDENGKEFELERVDEAGYFAGLIPKKELPKKLGRKKTKTVPAYTYHITYDIGTKEKVKDPYSFDSYITAMDEKKFNSGTHYEIYDYLGAHYMERDGVWGTLFAVWAPNAVRVSVVGDFNLWDGRKHQMQLLPDSGIFELFIPNVMPGELYKYEIRIKGNAVKLKSDPYGAQMQLRPDNASIVCDLSSYEFKDEKWMSTRAEKIDKKAPVSIYEVHLGSFMRRLMTEEKPGFYSYRELAPILANYAKKMHYTHIELMPVMEHPLDASWGYQITGYYAATARYGTPQDLMYMIDYLHQKGIGVILDWVPAHFPKDECGLAQFDGTCLYEHLDPRQGCHPHWGTLIYNYGRPQVANFLIANALYWAEKFHIDGIRMDAVASMLYLDYGKEDGQWVANMYGGNENLEAIDLLRNLSDVFHKRAKGAVLIAEESTAWPKVTSSPKEDGLGFDYKWNMGWMNDFLDYMRTDPLFRKGKHGELTFSIFYAYSEDFILPFSHDEVVHGKGSMLAKMPGDYDSQLANLRACYAFMLTHPGKKHLFMGQDFGQGEEWNENEQLHWDVMDYDPKRKQMQEYVRHLNQFYLKHPALYELDYDPSGFEWMSWMDADHSMVIFTRHAEEEDLLVVCNFTPVVYENYQIGVPFAGKYKEVLNTDSEQFGGQGNVNARLKQSQKERWENREDSIRITVPPLGISVFTCTRLEEKTTKEKGKRKGAN